MRDRADQRVAFPAAGLIQAAAGWLSGLIRTGEIPADADHYRMILESQPKIVWTVDSGGRCDYFSPQWEEYACLEAAENVDGWLEQIHPDDKHNCLGHRALCLKTGEPFAFEYRFLRASDRTWRRCLERGAPTFDTAGRIAGLIGTCTDIGDYRGSPRSIEEYRSNLQGVLDAATEVSIIATDAEGIIQIFNSGAERMLQYPASEMEGVRTPEILHDSAECAEWSQLLSREFGQPVKGIQAIFEYACRSGTKAREGTYLRKDHTRLDVSLAVTAIRDPTGGLQGFLCVATDITARKSLERELRLNNERLLGQTKSAEAANLAKSDFLAVTSHEIRTPMNAILGMADLLWESPLDAEQIQYVEVVRRAGASLLVLINNILDLSKIEAGGVELERIDFNLAEVVDEVIELVAPKARAKGLSLTSHSSPGLVTTLAGDPNRLRQVLVNILGNAVKFTDSGTIEMGVRNRESGHPGEIEFSVSDTGIGIPADKLEMIFEDYTQADASTTRKYGGSGLGLGISRRLVESMGGRLTVASSVGKGSTFRFYAQFEPAAGRRKALAGTEKLGGRRLLVIDGNAASRIALGRTINACGMESDLCGELEPALAGLAGVMAGDHPYALVLLDIGLDIGNGEKEGIEKARRIRQLAPDLPIVVLTNGVRGGDARPLQEDGLAGFAIKPVQRDELLRVVSKVIDSHEAAHSALTPLGVQQAKLEKTLRILLVEDAADNRLLVRSYMKGTRHQLNIAEDGKSAVDRFRAADFDLILMDVQMPVMDGLSATREIRSIEQERGSAPVPIIALTANARPQDVEMSRQAGCDAHLSKPISRAKLLQVIEEYGNPWAQESNGIEVEADLGEITPGYLAGRREELPRLMALLAASDFERIAQLAHNIKGTGTSYGFVDLSRIGAALEIAAKQRDSGAADAQLAQLNDFLEHIRTIAPGAGGTGMAVNKSQHQHQPI
jgi:PAS domain S-box-containing protein